MNKLTESEFRRIVAEEIRDLFEQEKEVYATYKISAEPQDLEVGVVMDSGGVMEVVEVSGHESGKSVKGVSPEDEEAILDVVRSGNAERIDVQIEEKVEEDPCWEGYTQVGMKTDENGNEVPNCVPTEDVPDAEGYQEESISEAVGSDVHQKLVRTLSRLGVRRAEYNRATDSIIIDNDMQNANISNLKKSAAGGWKAEISHNDGYDIARSSSLDDLGREIERTLR